MLFKIILEVEKKKPSFSIKQKNKISKSKSDVFQNLNPNCEPQLGRRKLYRNISKSRLVDKNNSENMIELSICWVLNFSDGFHSLKEISKKSNLPLKLIQKTAKLLVEKKLIKKIN